MKRRLMFLASVACLLTMIAGCAYVQERNDRTTKRDKTKKGAAIGAASGAFLGAVLGEGELDEILAGAAIGAGIGAGVGAYMDKQEEELARIPGTTVERVDDDMILVHFESDVLFAVDSSDLNSLSRSALDQATGVFADYPKTAIIVQGHTDSTGADDYNQSLSERRARSVASYLSARGLDRARILSEGYGERYPVDTNDTSSGRDRNRRVDLLLKAKAR